MALHGSFSTVSKPNFASKDKYLYFFAVFLRCTRSVDFCTATNPNCRKSWQSSRKSWQTSVNTCPICWNCVPNSGENLPICLYIITLGFRSLSYDIFSAFIFLNILVCLIFDILIFSKSWCNGQQGPRRRRAWTSRRAAWASGTCPPGGQSPAAFQPAARRWVGAGALVPGGTLKWSFQNWFPKDFGEILRNSQKSWDNGYLDIKLSRDSSFIQWQYSLTFSNICSAKHVINIVQFRWHLILIFDIW